MNGSELIEKYIEKQRELGKKDSEIVGKFYYSGAIYELKKAKRKGFFTLKIDYGIKDLRKESFVGGSK